MMRMRLGISGTREGMTPKQAETLGDFICRNAWRIREFHHGDCKGVDDQAATLVSKHGIDCKTIVHPPLDNYLQAYNEFFDEMREPKSFLARNRDIVHESDEVVIVPKEFEPQSKGGTWMTYRYALSLGRTIHVIWPDGKIESMTKGCC